jgi:Tol biopolymer transport system component
MSFRRAVLLVLVMLGVPACSGNINHTGSPVPLITLRASVSSSGVQANIGAISRPAISGDGRFTAFSSSASTLVAGDTNGFSDIFLFDRLSGTTTRVSVDSTGAQPLTGGDAFNPAISADGRYVAFDSNAPDLVAGDGNGVRDVFWKDTQMGTVLLVSRNGATQGDLDSANPSISADGRYVVFESASTTLGGPASPPGTLNIYLWDRNPGGSPILTRVSVGNGGAATNASSRNSAISADGRFVAFGSDATNLLSVASAQTDVYLWDRTGALAVRRVSITPTGGEPTTGGSDSPSISGDGRFVAFTSQATDLVTPGSIPFTSAVFVRDMALTLSATVLVSVNSDGLQSTFGSQNASISGDGTRVAFDSLASNLVVDDTNAFEDVFVHDLKAGTTVRVSVRTYGGQALGGDSVLPALSADGQSVAFNSAAFNLVPGDTNGVPDFFVRGP